MLQLFCASNANKDTMNKHEQGSSVNVYVYHEARHIVAVGSFTHCQSESKNQICQRLPAADPGFSRRGGGAQTFILTSFPPKYVKIEKKLD